MSNNENEMEKYFRDCFEWDGINPEDETIEHLCNIALDEYKRVTEYPRNIQIFPNLTDRIADHLRGLPSPFYPEFSHYEIEEQLKSWGIRNVTPAMVENSWKYWANWIIKKAKKDQK